ncbi:hypothetical protein TYRP_021859 [Tyrophagus putrescentiae]|nr:hypothetical protein TYRP_021859 [Tyrophagus putrescentiae]
MNQQIDVSESGVDGISLGVSPLDDDETAGEAILAMVASLTMPPESEQSTRGDQVICGSGRLL